MQSVLVILMQYIFRKYSRQHIGGGTAGNDAEFPPASSVHVVAGSLISSKPKLQVYVAVSFTEFPVNVTVAFARGGELRHSAAEEEV